MPALGESSYCDVCGDVFATTKGHNCPGPRALAPEYESTLCSLRGCGEQEGIMTPVDFAPFDFLNCSAIAIDEAGSGRPAKAEAAWLEACLAASGLYAPYSAADSAVSVILKAARPDSGDRGRPALWSALAAASRAALAVMDGRPRLICASMAEAFVAAALLESPHREAVTVLLAEIGRRTGTGN